MSLDNAACRGNVDVGVVAVHSSPVGADVFVAGATIAALGQGVLAFADRHSFDVGMDLGDGAPIVASDVSVVPGVVSLGAVGFFLGSSALEGGGFPVAVEDDVSVF